MSWPLRVLEDSVPLVMAAADVRKSLSRMAHEIVEGSRGEAPVLVGIHTRGVPLARRIASAIEGFAGSRAPVGALDIGLYRDDLASRPAMPLAATRLPVDITDRIVVLVDDVLYTGRTVRAAMDALNAFGRPAVIRLAVLVDRGHRQLPIRPDHVGKNLPTAASERVSVRLVEIDRGEDGVWIEPGAPGISGADGRV